MFYGELKMAVLVIHSAEQIVLSVPASYEGIYLVWGSNRWADSDDRVEIFTKYCNTVGKIRLTLFIH